ncbi:MAG: WD40-like beta Propeller, partial [Acidobacteria bacterium]|nr:WD40-like beta Propeller [Acidobacteriota bacterium]
DGSNARQITHNGAANFCPLFTPDGKRIIFSSNMLDTRGREFDIFIVNKDGTGDPERITTAPAFDGFPIFSPDGQWLVWGSNRANPEGHDTNLFIARWAE